MATRRTHAVRGLVAIPAAIAASLVLAPASARQPETGAVRDATRRAMVAIQQLGTPEGSERQLRTYVAGTQLDHLLETGVAADVARDGGVDDFRTSTVVVTGDEATISGTAWIWLNGREVRGQVAFDAHLVRVDGRWQVDVYSDQFVPGTGP